MNGVSHYPRGTNAFQNVPPRGTDKPTNIKPTRKAKSKALQAAISLETPEERKARKEAEATKFIHYAGKLIFDAKLTQWQNKVKRSRLVGRGVYLGRDI